jgi:hypothetical protein
MDKQGVPGRRSGTVFTIARRLPDTLIPRFPLLTIGTPIQRCRHVVFVLGQAGPLGHPGVHPHGRRRRWAELAPPARPRHAFGLHLALSGSLKRLTAIAPAYRTPAGARFYLEQPVRRSEDSPCGKRVWKDSVERIDTIDRFMGWPTAVGMRGFLCAGLPSDVKVVFTALLPTPRAKNRRNLIHARRSCASLIPAHYWAELLDLRLDATASPSELPHNGQILTESR